MTSVVYITGSNTTVEVSTTTTNTVEINTTNTTTEVVVSNLQGPQGIQGPTGPSVTGASGTFTSSNGKTITVTNGVITSIVP